MNKGMVILLVIIVAGVAIFGGVYAKDNLLNKPSDGGDDDTTPSNNNTAEDPPTASFVIKTPSDDWTVGTNITFDGAASHAAKDYSSLQLKGISKFEWKINGQAILESSNSSVFIHVFPAAGDNIVTLTVYDNITRTQASTSKNMTIRPATINLEKSFYLASDLLIPDNGTAEFTVDSSFETLILNVNITAKNGNKELPPNHQWKDAVVQMVIKADGVELASQEYTLAVNNSMAALPVMTSDSFAYMPEEIFGSDPISDSAEITVEFLCVDGYTMINLNYIVTY